MVKTRRNVSNDCFLWGLLASEIFIYLHNIDDYYPFQDSLWALSQQTITTPSPPSSPSLSPHSSFSSSVSSIFLSALSVQEVSMGLVRNYEKIWESDDLIPAPSGTPSLFSSFLSFLSFFSQFFKMKSHLFVFWDSKFLCNLLFVFSAPVTFWRGIAPPSYYLLGHLVEQSLLSTPFSYSLAIKVFNWSFLFFFEL